MMINMINNLSWWVEYKSKEESALIQQFLFDHGYGWLSSGKTMKELKSGVFTNCINNSPNKHFFIAVVDVAGIQNIKTFEELKTLFGIPKYTYESLDVL